MNVNRARCFRLRAGGIAFKVFSLGLRLVSGRSVLRRGWAEVGSVLGERVLPSQLLWALQPPRLP